MVYVYMALPFKEGNKEFMVRIYEATLRSQELILVPQHISCRCRPHAGLLDAAAHTLACPAFEGPAAARGDSWCRAEQPRQTPGSRHPCGRVRQLPIRTTGRAVPDQGPVACRQQCVWGPRGGPPGPSTIPVESHEAKLLSPEHGIGPRRPRGLGSTPLGPRRQLCSAGAPGPGPHGCPARHSHWPMWGQSNPP